MNIKKACKIAPIALFLLTCTSFALDEGYGDDIPPKGIELTKKGHLRAESEWSLQPDGSYIQTETEENPYGAFVSFKGGVFASDWKEFTSVAKKQQHSESARYATFVNKNPAQGIDELSSCETIPEAGVECGVVTRTLCHVLAKALGEKDSAQGFDHIMAKTNDCANDQREQKKMTKACHTMDDVLRIVFIGKEAEEANKVLDRALKAPQFANFRKLPSDSYLRFTAKPKEGRFRLGEGTADVCKDLVTWKASDDLVSETKEKTTKHQH